MMNEESSNVKLDGKVPPNMWVLLCISTDVGSAILGFHFGISAVLVDVKKDRPWRYGDERKSSGRTLEKL